MKFHWNMKTTFLPVESPSATKDGFTFIELLVMLVVVALLAVTLLPALANTPPGSRAFQCLNNQRQIMLALRMYAEDNNDLFPPNEYPYITPFSTATATAQNTMRNWAVGTMLATVDSANGSILTNRYSVLSPYINTPASYRCPADTYIDPATHKVHARSYSMNSAVGTMWYSSTAFGGFGQIGAPVAGGWLGGNSYTTVNVPWFTYGKFSSIIRPTPANLFVIIEENPYSINDSSIAISASASSGDGYLIDWPAANHDQAATIAFADGHSIVHKWLSPDTYSPQTFVAPGQGSQGSRLERNNQDLSYLAGITSAHR